MGADFPGDEEAIQEIRRLSPRALEWIHHHFGNSMTAVVGGIEIGDYDLVKKAAQHICADLKKINSRQQWDR